MVTRYQTANLKPKIPSSFNAITTSITYPTSYSQAIKYPYWREAIQNEYNAFMKNGTWQLVSPDPKQNIVGCKWVFRTKRKPDGYVERYKARLVAKWYTQCPGIDFLDIFNPVVKPNITRLLFSIVVSRGWKVTHINISNIFFT